MRIKIVILISMIATAILTLFVFATGQTFGQKCAKKYEKHTTEWCDCVQRLNQGYELKTK
jgi:membrane protein DedA with SNARE-associated domain